MGRRGCGKAWRSLTPRFSANRAVREYTEQHYLPAAAAYRERAADKGAVGRQMVDWQQALEGRWGTLRFGEIKVKTDREQHMFEAQVISDDLDPECRASRTICRRDQRRRSGPAGDEAVLPTGTPRVPFTQHR